MSREEFWNSRSADIINDLLIDVMGREEIRDILNGIRPGYTEDLAEAKKDYKSAYLIFLKS